MSATSEFNLGGGVIVVGNQVGGESTTARLVQEAEAYGFCQPLPGAAVLEGRQKVEVDEKRARTVFTSTGVNVWRTGLADGAIARNWIVNGLFMGRRQDKLAAAEQDMSGLFLDQLSTRLKTIYTAKPIPDPYRSTIAAKLIDILIADAFAGSDDQAHAVAAAFRAGYMPLQWVGDWPHGYLHVYCPADRPHVKTVSVDGEAETSAARQRFSALKDRYRAHPGYVDAPAVRIDYRGVWKRLAERNSRDDIQEHFLPLVRQEADRKALEVIVANFQRITANAKTLVVHLRDSFGDDFALRCSPPWQGALTHVPEDLIPLLRLHNGMSLDLGSDTPELFTFDGKVFDIGRDRHRGFVKEGIFALEPWSVTPPLVPLTNGQDLYAYHPTEVGAGGRALLCMASHETPTTKQMDSGASGFFLQMVAEYLL